MSKLLTQNAKIKKTSKITGIKTFNFTLPAKKTCPMAKDCLKFCYASKWAFTWSNVKAKHEANLKATKQKDFVKNIILEVTKKNIEAVRIHDSGDFYNKRYLGKWIKIATQLPNVTFYAYTKSIHLFKGNEDAIPKNMVIVYSFGGKMDHLINISKDKHAVVYKEKLPKGYSYANDNDHVALAMNKKIGLKLH